MDVRILGPLQVVLDSGQLLELSDRQTRLLARLAAAEGPVTFTELAATLGDSGAMVAAERVLEVHLSALSTALGPGRLLVTDDTATFELADDELDARRFTAEASDALGLLTEGDPESVRRLLTLALGRWCGDVFGGTVVAGASEPVEQLVRLRARAEHALHDLSHEPAAEGAEITFVLTDVVGSTAQWELAPAGMHAALEHHDRLITEVITEHGGRCIKHRGEGDSTFSIFDAPTNAVVAAAAILEAMSAVPWPVGVDVQVRMSVYTGRAIERTGDYYGPTVNRAARLRGMARGGMALVSGATAGLVRGRLPDFLELNRVGLLSLRDIPDPEEAFELVNLRLASPRTDNPSDALDDGHRRWATLPAAIRATGTQFAGRQDELSALLGAFRQARRGSGRAMFIGGDPGIGKTRLTAEFARAALLEGAIVAFGRADHEQGLPFRSYVEALSDLVAAAPALILDRYVEAFGGELGRIVPLLGRRVPWLPPPVVTDTETERHRLFDAVRGFIEHVSVDGPVVLLLDDVHDAGPETIHLTRYLLDESVKLPLTIVATYRDGEIRSSGALAQLLTHARRQSNSTMLTLSGLPEKEVSTLVAELLPARPRRAELVTRLATETGGNPLFTIEILRTIAATEDPTATPSAPSSDRLLLPHSETVRDVIGRRIERLGSSAAAMLTTAAIVGRDFDLSVVALAAGAGEEEVLLCVELAIQAHLVQEAATPGSFVFAHGLIPNVLLESLSSVRRARLHVSVADAVEQLWGVDSARAAEALARHLVAAGAAAERRRTIVASIRAGDRAIGQLAPAQAAHWYRAALERIDGDERERIQLQVKVGVAERQAGLRTFRETLLDASTSALAAGANDLLLDAVLANNRGARARTFFVDRERVEALRSAIASGDGIDSPQMARALALLSLELSHDADEESRLEVSDRALAMARRVGDPDAMCEVLRTRFETIRLKPDTSDRWAETEELLEIAARENDLRELAFGLMWRARLRLQIGDVDGLDADIARSVELSARVIEPYLRWNLASHASYRAAMHGDLAAAERGAADCYTVAKQGGQPDAEAVLASHLLVIRDAQGRLDEMVGAQRRAVAAVPDSGALRAVAAFVFAEAGEVDDARAELDTFTATNGSTIVRDLLWMTAMAYLGRASIRLQHAPAAELVRRSLEPWAEHVFWSGSSALGPVATVLSGTALVSGDPDGALMHARAALEIARRTRSPLWIVEALCAEAAALEQLELDPDRRNATLAEAGSIAERYGFARFAALYESNGGHHTEVTAHG